jgi:hypothetical protein
LDGQGFGGPKLVVRLVGVQGLKRLLSAEPVEQAEQAIGAPLQHGQTHAQDPEDGMILVLSFHKFYISNLFITLYSVLQKASTRGQTLLLRCLATCTSRQCRHDQEAGKY